MFNSISIKVLARENANLRRQVRDRDKTINELLDKFLHHKAPERIVDRTIADRPDYQQHQTSLPSDAYSSAINDAEKKALELLQLGYPKPDDINENEDD